MFPLVRDYFPYEAYLECRRDNEYLVEVRPTLEFVLRSADITRIGAQVTLLVFNNEIGFSKNQH